MALTLEEDLHIPVLAVFDDDVNFGSGDERVMVRDDVRAVELSVDIYLIQDLERHVFWHHVGLHLLDDQVFWSCLFG